MSLFDIPHRFSFAGVWNPTFWAKEKGVASYLLENWQISTIFTAQSGRPFSVWNGASSTAGGDYNRDAGGGAVGGGFYDRPNAPATVFGNFRRNDFLNGLFPASAFPTPIAGTSGNLGRNTYRGPGYTTVDVSVSRKFIISENKSLILKLDAFNAFNKVNLFLPNADMSLSTFGKSTQAFEPRTMQASVKFLF